MKAATAVGASEESEDTLLISKGASKLSKIYHKWYIAKRSS